MQRSPNFLLKGDERRSDPIYAADGSILLAVLAAATVPTSLVIIAFALD